MEPKLKEIHKNMIDLFDESYKKNRDFINIRGQKESLAVMLDKIKKIHWEHVFIHVNSKDSSPHTQLEIEKKKNNIEVWSKSVLKAAKKFGLEEQAQKCIIDRDDSNEYLTLEIQIEKYLRSIRNQNGAKKEIEKLLTKYNDLVFNFNRNNGKGWYDYFGNYDTGNVTNYNKFIEEIDKLKKKGFDIIITHDIKGNDKTNREIGILTNSGNIRKIHDIIYQKCSRANKFQICGRFMIPKFNKELNNKLLDNAPKAGGSTFNMFGNSDNNCPDFLRDCYIASVDAFGYTKGYPQKAILGSMLSAEAVGYRNNPSCFAGNPLKMANELKKSQSIKNIIESKKEENQKNTNKLKI